MSTGDPDRLMQLMYEFMYAETWSESRSIVDQHPELLSEATAQFLEYVEVGEVGSDTGYVYAFEEARALLRRCREAGVDATFAEIELALLSQEADDAEEAYLRTDNVQALNVAVDARDRYLRHPLLPSDFRPSALNNAGNAFLRRYEATGRPEDLRAALSYLTKGVAQTQPNSPDLPSHLNNLARGLTNRYARSGDDADLELAIEAFENALAQAPGDWPHLPACLANLGVSLRIRYDRSGDLADLERAIEAFAKLGTHSSPDSLDRSSHLGVLGVCLRDRYARSGDLVDLERAIEAFEEVLAQPAGLRELLGYRNNLGVALRDRYARFGDSADLERAIETFAEVAKQAPRDWPELPGCLTNLGIGLVGRFNRTDKRTDLDRAIKAFEQAVEHAPPGTPNRPRFLNNFGGGLRDRYVRFGKRTDLKRAIKAFEQAVALSRPGSPGLSMYLNNLGLSLAARYDRFGQPVDRERAIQAFRDGCVQGLQAGGEFGLIAAKGWGEWATKRESWNEATEAYRFGLQAVARLFRTQLLRRHKEAWLREAEGIPARAAYALAQAVDPEAATVALEHGRALLLSEILERDRFDLDRLPALGHTNVYERYRQVTDRLNELERADLDPIQATLMPAQQAKELRAARGWHPHQSQPRHGLRR